MALKVRETCMVSDFNELKQKLIELETEARNFGNRRSPVAVTTDSPSFVRSFEFFFLRPFLSERQNNVSKRQAKRLQDEVDKLEEKLSEASLREDELVNETKDLQRNISNLNAKVTRRVRSTCVTGAATIAIGGMMMTTTMMVIIIMMVMVVVVIVMMVIAMVVMVMIGLIFLSLSVKRT